MRDEENFVRDDGCDLSDARRSATVTRCENILCSFRIYTQFFPFCFKIRENIQFLSSNMLKIHTCVACEFMLSEYVFQATCRLPSARV